MNKSITYYKGTPYPLGAYVEKNKYNFAVFAQHAEKVFLGLFSSNTSTPQEEYPLIRTGDIWHIALTGIPDHVTYAYRAEGPQNKKLL